MLLLPLAVRSDSARPPYLTLVLIALCVLVFVGLQRPDAERSAAAAEFYASSSLPSREMPAFFASLRQRGQEREAAYYEHAARSGGVGDVASAMQHDREFMFMLRAGGVLSRDHPDYSKWHAAREHYEELRAKVITDSWALDGRYPTALSLVAYLFMHADWMHLIGNMLVLFMVGCFVERALGATRYLAFYLLAGMASTLCDMLWPETLYIRSLGASGAISGVMAMYVVLLGLRQVPFFYFVGVYFSTARLPALLVLPVWLGNELLQKLVFSPDSRVNYLAHLFGLLSGALLTLLYRYRRGWHSAPWVEQGDQQEASDLLHVEAKRWLRELNFERAAQCYLQLVRANRGNVELTCEYFRVAKLANQPTLLNDAFKRLLRCAVAQPRALETRVLADALRLAAERQLSLPSLPDNHWLDLSHRLIDGGELELADRLLLKMAPRIPDNARMAAQLYRLARLWRTSRQTGRAERLERRLLTLHANSSEARQLLAREAG